MKKMSKKTTKLIPIKDPYKELHCTEVISYLKNVYAAFQGDYAVWMIAFEECSIVGMSWGPRGEWHYLYTEKFSTQEEAIADIKSFLFEITSMDISTCWKISTSTLKDLKSKVSKKTYRDLQDMVRMTRWMVEDKGLYFHRFYRVGTWPMVTRKGKHHGEEK